MLDKETATRVRDALYAQKYNLLVGAGLSLDSRDKRGTRLLSTEALRQNLCKITNAREDSPLWRVAGYLNERQIESELTTPFFGSRAGPSMKAIPALIWKYIFSLNIDDALEDAYGNMLGRVQSCVPVNYSNEFEIFRNPQEVPIIHVHGFVRQAQDKYVFSMQEYARVQQGINPWIHLLSSLLISEPFIIAGTSLFEPDLEYFLAARTSQSVVGQRAPSLLIEPSPDAGTSRDCERLGLTLVKATFTDFVDWVLREFGPCPSPAEVVAPRTKPRLTAVPSSLATTAFWTDFEFVGYPLPEPSPAIGPSPFMFGRKPSWADIAAKKDVALRSQLELIDECRRWVASSEQQGIICLLGQAGSGKSTTLKRVTAELAERDFQVFYIKATDGLDVSSAAEYLSATADPLLVVVDSLAEFGDEVTSLMVRLRGVRRLLVLGAERTYRKRYLANVLDDRLLKYIEAKPWRKEELRTLIGRYIAQGLVGNSDVQKNPDNYAKEIEGDLISVAICRVLNDFRPLSTIVRSLWNDTSPELRHTYLAVAAADYCAPIGIRKRLVTDAFGIKDVSALLHKDSPLGLVHDSRTEEFVAPTNSSFGALLVEEAAKDKNDLLLSICVRVANALAPYVTRSTIRQHTAEAKLAGRLFDAADVVQKLFGESGLVFFDQTHDLWKWNSRYWEQRALYVAHRDLDLAIRHARHAVGIERHPFPMTTLSILLFRAARLKGIAGVNVFTEAFNFMTETFRKESQWERGRTKTAIFVFLNGVCDYIEAGGRCSPKQADIATRIANEALADFPKDPGISEKAKKAATLIGAHVQKRDAL